MDFLAAWWIFRQIMLFYQYDAKMEMIMNNNISMDLILSEEACNVLDSFVAMLKLHVVFYSADGKILRSGRNFGNSKYCELMQKEYFGLDLCCKLDREKQIECAKKSQMLCYRCHAGLNELIAPCRPSVIHGSG
jgi:ligand-binding sensor protein